MSLDKAAADLDRILEMNTTQVDLSLNRNLSSVEHGSPLNLDKLYGDKALTPNPQDFWLHKNDLPSKLATKDWSRLRADKECGLYNFPPNTAKSSGCLCNDSVSPITPKDRPRTFSLNDCNLKGYPSPDLKGPSKNPFLKGIEVQEKISDANCAERVYNNKFGSPQMVPKSRTCLQNQKFPQGTLNDIVTLKTLDDFKAGSCHTSKSSYNPNKSSSCRQNLENESSPLEPQQINLTGKFGDYILKTNHYSQLTLAPQNSTEIHQKVVVQSSVQPGGQLYKSLIRDEDYCPTGSEPPEVTFEIETCLYPETCSACSLTQDLETTLSSIINEKFFKNAPTTDGDSSNEFTPLDPKKYKTELCRPYQVHGYCKYGFKCNYAHGLNQLKVSFRHGKYKTRNCESYHKTGSCRYGARCSFIHDPEEGIMKCAITDREVLDALHCHPSSNYIASITWRITDPLYPPTELYFFTPSYEKLSEGKPDSKQDASIASTKSSDQNSDTVTTVQSLENCEYVPSITYSLTLPSIVCSEVSSTSEEDSCSAIQECSQVSRSGSLSSDTPSSPQVCQQNGQEKLRPIASPEVFGNSQPFKRTNHIAGYMPYKKGSLRNGRYLQRTYPMQHQNPPFYQYGYLGHSSNQGHPSRTCRMPNFSLDDFLRCLKTEGQHHLASWSPEKKVSKITRVPKDTKLKVPNKDAKGLQMKRDRDLAKYKTELCRSYQYNKYCEYGNNCLYAHGIDDLRCYPKHPMYRTKKCFSFHHRGFCLYGSRCQFLHNTD